MTNDELRQAWMGATVPLCGSLVLKAPAHCDEASGEYVLDYPLPCAYDAAAKHRDSQGGEITWHQVFVRWKQHGPHAP